MPAGFRQIGLTLIALAASAYPAGADVRPAKVLDLSGLIAPVNRVEAAQLSQVEIVGSKLPPLPASALWLLIASAANKEGVPADFLLRLLRRESGLNALAVSPKGALGIAQFMPATASERGLLNPLDPEQAIPKAAELLRDLRARFGSWGLAAAAYNAGAGRIEAWLFGSSALPQETADYVAHITGIEAAVWATAYRVRPTALASADAGQGFGLTLAGPLAGASPGGRGVDAMMALSRLGPQIDVARPRAKLPASSGRDTAAIDAVFGRMKKTDLKHPCAALLDQQSQCISWARY